MIQKGARGPHYMGERTEWFNGQFRRVRRWEGSETEIRGMESGLKANFDSYSINRIGNSPLWFAEAILEGDQGGGTDDTVEIFELLTNTVQQPARYSAVLQGKLTPDDIGVIVAVHNRIKTGRADYLYSDAEITINAQVSNSGAGLELLDDLLAGVNNFFEFEYVLRWTRNAHKSVLPDPNYTNASKIYTTSSGLISSEGMTSEGLPFTLPTKEWLKLPPQVRYQFGGRVEIIYEYWAADVWSRLYYALAT